MKIQGQITLFNLQSDHMKALTSGYRGFKVVTV
jgi:hypothetical protein